MTSPAHTQKEMLAEESEQGAIDSPSFFFGGAHQCSCSCSLCFSLCSVSLFVWVCACACLYLSLAGTGAPIVDQDFFSTGPSPIKWMEPSPTKATRRADTEQTPPPPVSRSPCRDAQLSGARVTHSGWSRGVGLACTEYAQFS